MSAAPWRRQYDQGVPETLAPYPEQTLLDVVARAARECPARPAVLFKRARVSYRQLARQSDAFAAALIKRGVRRGDRLALLLPNCPQFLVAEFGAWKAGAVVVPLNPTYTDGELARALRETGPETIVVLTAFYERLKALQMQTPLRRVIVTNIKEYLPRRLRWLFTLFKEKQGGHRVTLHPGDLAFGALLREGGRPSAAAAAGPGDTALILLSGGTTGTPKGVVCPHRGVVATGLQAHAWARSLTEDGQAVMMQPLPLFHAAAGLLSQAICLVGGITLALVPDPRDIPDLLATIRWARPTFLVGVPTLFSALLKQPAVQEGRVDFSSIKLCFCGAAPLMAETRRRFEQVSGARIVEAYSLTEALVALVMGPVKGTAKPGSVGLPLPDVELRIVDATTGRGDLPPGAVGEVLLRAPQIMPGYWNNPEESALALRDHGDGKPWLHTADLGYLDPDGYLFIVDRLKDVIKPGGLQVWPREVEEVLASHPAVAEVGVAGLPDPDRGEAVKAWVVLREGASASAEELRAYCKERLAPFKVPSRLEFRPELPKSMVGKVLRRALVEEEKSGHANP